ncbi:hypothetical protein OIU79_028924 [Salix purpurea]|uniref:Uncharacterized protein n=1 Tax=Salix purpurea TaxID=77065 RepID=A0A9Q0VXI2_SALPP|nr:hypothetical protein OIU79_028924 [Salix purpurea]
MLHLQGPFWRSLFLKRPWIVDKNGLLQFLRATGLPFHPFPITNNEKKLSLNYVIS